MLLHTDVINLSPAARAASMVRVADAMTGHHARAALVKIPRGAAYHKANAGGIGSGMAKIVALLYAGATQAGIELGESASGEEPNSEVVRPRILKRLQKASATKKKAHADRISKLLGALSGPTGSSRLYVGCMASLVRRLSPPRLSRIPIERAEAAT